VSTGPAAPSPAYEDLDENAQVEVLRRVAVTAAQRYGLRTARLEPVLHGFNTTFRVDTADGARLALRVNTNSVSTAEHVAAQQAWVHAIARDTDLRVPDAVAAPDGRPPIAAVALVRRRAISSCLRLLDLDRLPRGRGTLHC